MRIFIAVAILSLVCLIMGATGQRSNEPQARQARNTSDLMDLLASLQAAPPARESRSLLPDCWDYAAGANGAAPWLKELAEEPITICTDLPPLEPMDRFEQLYQSDLNDWLSDASAWRDVTDMSGLSSENTDQLMGAPQPVPEPISLMLLAGGGAMLLQRRRHG
jgi:hypothetical protein